MESEFLLSTYSELDIDETLQISPSCGNEKGIGAGIHARVPGALKSTAVPLTAQRPHRGITSTRCVKPRDPSSTTRIRPQHPATSPQKALSVRVNQSSGAANGL